MDSYPPISPRTACQLLGFSRTSRNLLTADGIRALYSTVTALLDDETKLTRDVLRDAQDTLSGMTVKERERLQKTTEDLPSKDGERTRMWAEAQYGEPDEDEEWQEHALVEQWLDDSVDRWKCKG